jgi:hypothetical protein
MISRAQRILEIAPVILPIASLIIAGILGGRAVVKGRTRTKYKLHPYTNAYRTSRKKVLQQKELSRGQKRQEQRNLRARTMGKMLQKIRDTHTKQGLPPDPDLETRTVNRAFYGTISGYPGFLNTYSSDRW